MPNSEILMIEDDDVFFCALKPRLERKGFRVVRARDGAEGLTKCKRGKYSLVITDIVLPRMNGFEIVRSLKNDYQKSFNFVVLSNLGTDIKDSDKEFLRSLGISKYLVKSKHSVAEIANLVVECIV